MTAEEFVAALANANPSIADFVSVGLTPGQAKNMRRGYDCPARQEPLGIAETNAILALMNRWETRKVEVGMVRLASRPVRHPKGVKIGLVEPDDLVIHPGNDLAVHELGVPENVLWRVARSPEAFLKALAVAAKFLGERAVEKIDYDDIDAAKAVAKKCSKLAGGDTYHDFYAMLLGADE